MFPHVFKVSSPVVCRQFARGMANSNKHAFVKDSNVGKPVTTGEALIGLSTFGLALFGPLLWTVSSIAHGRWGGRAKDGDDDE